MLIKHQGIDCIVYNNSNGRGPRRLLPTLIEDLSILERSNSTKNISPTQISDIRQSTSVWESARDSEFACRKIPIDCGNSDYKAVLIFEKSCPETI